MVLCMIKLRALKAVKVEKSPAVLILDVSSAWKTSKMETYVGLFPNATMSSIKNA